MDPTTPPDRLRPAVLFRWGALFSLGAASTVIGLYALYTVRAILVRILIALFIAVSLDPAVRWLTRRGMRRGWAVTLIFLLAFAFAAGFLLSVIPPLVTQGRNLVDNVPEYLGRLQDRSSQFRELDDRYNISEQLQGLVGTLPSRLGTGVLGFTSRVVGRSSPASPCWCSPSTSWPTCRGSAAGWCGCSRSSAAPGPARSSTWWSTRSAAT